MVIWVFLAEVLDMALLAVLPSMRWEWQAFLDGLVLLVWLSPGYFMLYRPALELWEERIRNEDEIRRLSWELIHHSERERQRLSHDLHDEFGQVLSTLRFGLENIQEMPSADEGERRHQFDRLFELLDMMGDQVQSFSALLRPPLLDDIGLVPSLRWYLKRQGPLVSGIKVSFRAEDFKERLPAEIELALYRIFQEGLNNATKHAQAERVDIRLFRKGRSVFLSIEDDGKGMDLEEVRRNTQRIGLLGMRERAASLGGTLEIFSEKGRGTRLQVTFPTNRG